MDIGGCVGEPFGDGFLSDGLVFGCDDGGMIGWRVRLLLECMQITFWCSWRHGCRIACGW